MCSLVNRRHFVFTLHTTAVSPRDLVQYIQFIQEKLIAKTTHGSVTDWSPVLCLPRVVHTPRHFNKFTLLPNNFLFRRTLVNPREAPLFPRWEETAFQHHNENMHMHPPPPQNRRNLKTRLSLTLLVENISSFVMRHFKAISNHENMSIYNYVSLY